LLGPTGKSVVKLFVFAEKEDYEWVAQDGVMNQTQKNTALDLFNTPDHYLPQPHELSAPSATPLGTPTAAYQPPPGAACSGEEAAAAGAGRAAGSEEAAAAGAGAGRAPSSEDVRSGQARAKLPVFWIAPLEAGGCPLLSPPNVIHCVITVRDCVMVEERRLSLMFLDEVGERRQFTCSPRHSSHINPCIFH